MRRIGAVAAGGHLEFTFTLQRALPATGNLVWSPLSVASALALIARGATGATRDEVVALLQGDKAASVEELASSLAAAKHVVGAADEEPPTVAVANTLWVDETVTVKDDFVTLLAKAGGGIKSTTFVADPAMARAAINGDVAETTRGLIPELLPADAFNKRTVAALVNALYLKVGWTYPFADAATKNQRFRTPDGVKAVPTMVLEETVSYASTAGWQLVRLAAAGGIEAVILLPDGDLATEPETTTVDRLLAESAERSVSLRMPRLQMSTWADLTDPISRLGVRTVFTDAAELTGVSDDPLGIQAVPHESVLTIDEYGMTGGAATAATIAWMSFEERLRIDVDRPFLLLVRHIETGAVYFSARVTDPSQDGSRP